MYYIQGKGYHENSGAKVCSKRQMALRLAKIYGYNGDSDSYTRLIIESRVNRQLMNEAYRNGAALKVQEATK